MFEEAVEGEISVVEDQLNDRSLYRYGDHLKQNSMLLTCWRYGADKRPAYAKIKPTEACAAKRSHISMSPACGNSCGIHLGASVTPCEQPHYTLLPDCSAPLNSMNSRPSKMRLSESLVDSIMLFSRRLVSVVTQLNHISKGKSNFRMCIH